MYPSRGAELAATNCPVESEDIPSHIFIGASDWIHEIPKSDEKYILPLITHAAKYLPLKSDVISLHAKPLVPSRGPSQNNGRVDGFALGAKVGGYEAVGAAVGAIPSHKITPALIDIQIFHVCGWMRTYLALALVIKYW